MRALGRISAHMLQDSLVSSPASPQVNAITFLANGLLATASGKLVALWDVNACAMKQTLNHEGAVRATAQTMWPPALRRPRSRSIMFR